MANWGVPDFKPDLKVDADAMVLRLQLADQGKVTHWDMKARPVQAGYPPAEVKALCVKCAYWQDVRLSMKGKPTDEKLKILEVYWDCHIDAHEREVQVGNYLGALRRGGQLDSQNRVRKFL